jgi:UDP-N-acetylmuramate--alanine ligase
MLEKDLRIHFIGIGGIGVSAVARIAVRRGYTVSGSDVRQSQLTDAMEQLGANVTIGHDASNVDDVDLVVVSTAIPEDNVEWATARERGIRTVHRSELLAAFLNETDVAIGITGTHGKGTISAMLTRVLDAAGRDPGFIIGGILNDYGINARGGSGDILVAEVDESDGSHSRAPVTHLLCNFLEADHLNYYDDLSHIVDSMVEAVENYDRLEALFLNFDCDGNRELAERVSSEPVTYGMHSDDVDYRCQLIGQGQLPIRFTIAEHGKSLGEFELPLPGHYNAVNATGAAAIARSLGVSADAIREGLADFHGLENRFTIDDAAGTRIVKDYNSHPTAMRKVLHNAKTLGDGRVVTVFKPYRYTLINYLKDEYATAFRGSDEVVITTMYAADEDPIPGVDTEFFVEMLRDQGHEVTFIEDQDDIVPYLDESTGEGDVAVFFGGDDFFAMADAWAAERNQTAN